MLFSCGDIFPPFLTENAGLPRLSPSVHVIRSPPLGAKRYPEAARDATIYHDRCVPVSEVGPLERGVAGRGSGLFGTLFISTVARVARVFFMNKISLNEMSWAFRLTWACQRLRTGWLSPHVI